MRQDVIGRAAQDARIVIKVSESEITLATNPTTELASLVVMVAR
jgi:hypothetical protein